MVSADRDHNEVEGIIFPVLPDHLQRFFEGQKTVFVKFVGRNTSPARLQPSSKLFFYKSGGDKEVVGEAKILQISSATVEEALTLFRDKLFLTQSELEEYAGNRKARKMLVLVLENIEKYAAPLRLNKSVTMAGCYMTRRMFKNLRSSGAS
jgi:hypothetical protein